MLHLPVYNDVNPNTPRSLALSERLDGFAEIIAGLSERRGSLRGATLLFLRQLALNATIATRPVPKAPSPSWVRAGATDSNMTIAPAVQCASNNAPSRH